MQVLAPRDEKDVVDAVGAALSNDVQIDIRGGGTRSGLGRPPQADVVLTLSGMSGITLYEPSELVISALAGTPLKAVREALTQNGQELAFEPMSHAALYGEPADAETIGGMISANASGPRRIKAGAARDHMLGFRAVNGRGELFKSGGRVMKNVTGYDMSKLMAGALGTLGILTEVTFKVLPMYASEKTIVVAGFDDAAAVREMTRVTGLSLEVSSVAHLPAGAALPNGLSRLGLAGQALTLFRLEGPEVSTSERCRALREELLSFAAPCETVGWLESQALWAHVRDVRPLADTGLPLWRISVAPAEGATLVARLKVRGLALGHYFYDWAGGLIWLALEADDTAGHQIIRDEVARLGGHATLVRASDALRRQIPVFQPQAKPLADLSARVRRSLDPKLILNRGRMREDL